MTASGRIAPDGVDWVVEVVPANLQRESMVLEPHGTWVFYAATADDPSLPVRSLMTLNAVLGCMLVYTLLRASLLMP